MDDWYTKFIVVPAITALVLGVIGTSIRGQATFDSKRGVGILNYSAALKRVITSITVLAVVATLMAALEWPIQATPGKNHSVVVIVFALFALAGAGLIWELRTRVEVTDTGVIHHSPWRGRISMDWPEVRDVNFRGDNFVLRARGGKTLRVSGHLSGMETLIAALRIALPPKVYTKSVGAYYEMRKASPLHPDDSE